MSAMATVLFRLLFIFLIVRRHFVSSRGRVPQREAHNQNNFQHNILSKTFEFPLSEARTDSIQFTPLIITPRFLVCNDLQQLPAVVAGIRTPQ